MPTTLPPGSTINGRYLVRSHLGGGSAGQVYRVFDDHMRVEVALKLLNPVSGQPAAWSEAQVLEHLQGDYLLPVYNADVVHGSDIRFITTKVMEGGDLESEASPHGVEVRTVVRWVNQISHAVERIHSAQMLHRDIKPGNAFLDDERCAHLADLGMAVLVGSDGRALPDGTLATVAPEALRVTDPYCSVKSDVFSLGATAYYLLSGEYPIVQGGMSRAHYRDLIVAGKRNRIRDVAPHVSRSLASVVERALSQDPIDRQPSALDFANQIASATHNYRRWCRVSAHSGHVMCFESIGDASRQDVTLCVIQCGGLRDVVPVQANGRVMRRFERTQVRPGDVARVLRDLCGSI